MLSILLIATIALLGGISGVIADELGDDEWPQYQSDTTNTGTIDTSGPEGELSTAWSALDDPVHSSPAIVDGVVYVGSNDGSVYALDADTGEEQWSLEIGDGVDSSPVVDQGVVYVGNDSGGLFAIDANTGDEEWSHTFDGLTTAGEAVGTPAVSEGYVFAHVGNRLHMLDIADGAERWDAYTGHQSSTPPAPTVVDDVVYVGSADGPDGSVRGFDVEDGTEVFRPQFLAAADGAPAVKDDTLYLGGGGATSGYMYAINVETESEEWRDDREGSKTAPTVVDDTVYFGNSEAGIGSEYHVVALNATTGDEIWTFELEHRIDGSPAVVDGRVYATDFNGSVYTLDAESGDLLESTQLRDPDDSSTMFTSPIVTENTVYIGANVYGSDDDTFYALRDGDGLVSPDLEVVSASLSDDVIEEGQSVTITAEIENTGDKPGEHIAELEIDDTVEDDASVKVDPNETEEIEFVHTFNEAGTFGVSVDDVEAGTVTVEEGEVEFGGLRVTVTDAAGDPIEGAGVWVVPPGESVEGEPEGTTNETGVFEDGGPASTWDVVVDADGYETERVEDVEVEAEEWTSVDVELTSQIAQYADDDGTVQTDGLREAIGDWRAGDIDTDLLRAVIDVWKSGDQVA